MTLKGAVDRLEKELFPAFEKSERGRGILEGALTANEKPLSRDLAVEMTALLIAIQEEWATYFHYKIFNWLHRAVFYMNWGDSLHWWAQHGFASFQSEYKDRHPMPEDLQLALINARSLINEVES